MCFWNHTNCQVLNWGAYVHKYMELLLFCFHSCRKDYFILYLHDLNSYNSPQCSHTFSLNLLECSGSFYQSGSGFYDVWKVQEDLIILKFYFKERTFSKSLYTTKILGNICSWHLCGLHVLWSASYIRYRMLNRASTWTNMGQHGFFVQKQRLRILYLKMLTIFHLCWATVFLS